MAKRNMAELNKSGTAQISKPESNVFEFIRQFRKNLADLKLNSVIVDIREGAISNIDVSGVEKERLVDACEKFLSAFQDYLLSGECSVKPVDDEIIKVEFANIDNAESSSVKLGKELGIKDSVYRVRRVRMTKRAYRNVFNRETVPDAVLWCANANEITKYYKRVRRVGFDFELKEVLSYVHYNKVINAISGVDYRSSDKITEADYLRALRFYFLYSEETFDYYLSSLNPRILALAKKQLEDISATGLAAKYREAKDNVSAYVLSNEASFVNSLADGEVEDYSFDERIVPEKTFEKPVIEEDFVAPIEKDLVATIKESAQTSSGVVNRYNLLVDDDFVRELDKVLQGYKQYRSNHKGLDEYMVKATPEVQEKAELFLSKLPFDDAKEELHKLNPYALVEALKKRKENN